MASDRVAPGRNWWDMLRLLALVANRWNRCIVGSMGYWFIHVDLNPGFHHRAICGSGAPRLEDRNEEPPITLGCLPHLFRICADGMCPDAAPNHPPKVIKPLFPKRGVLETPHVIERPIVPQCVLMLALSSRVLEPLTGGIAVRPFGQNSNLDKYDSQPSLRDSIWRRGFQADSNLNFSQTCLSLPLFLFRFSHRIVILSGAPHRFIA
jgi:hypothetical protein